MSSRNSRRRIPASSRKTRPQTQRRTPSTRTRSSKPKNSPSKLLQRCSSEPILWTVTLGEEQKPSLILPRHETCNDIFSYRSPVFSPAASKSPIFPPFSQYRTEKYKVDSKVVVNVTVEGSPGPIRAMVRLGASVEETIKLFVDKYEEEGRHPCLGLDFSSFELHHSYFSLESLDKRERIGDMGGRSFYLRKSSSRGKGEGHDEVSVSLDKLTKQSPPPNGIPPHLFTSFIARRISKIGRRTRKFWKVLGCMACG